MSVVATLLGMQVNFLGTGSAEPSKYRGASAIHIRSLPLTCVTKTILSVVFVEEELCTAC